MVDATSTINPASVLTPVVLTLAGSDPSAGAGIQADLKTFSALGVYGVTVISALTVQNTRGVQRVAAVPIDVVEQQLLALLDDMSVQVIKLGMLHSAAIVELVSKVLRLYPEIPVVCDPVIASSSGAPLLDAEGIALLREELLPLVTVLTPNLQEAALLLDGSAASNEAEMVQQAERLQAIADKAVLITGGHLATAQAIDVLVWQENNLRSCEVFRVDRIATRNTHGTGCTLASAIAAGLLKNMAVNDAVAMAKEYVSNALANADSLHLGSGPGPLQHFYQ